jgi:hypothetical protein
LTGLLFFALVFAQGLVWSSLLARKVGGALCAWAAWPLGLLLWVVVTTTAVLSPLSASTPTLMTLWGAGLAAGAALVWRRRVDTFDPSLLRPMLAVSLCVCIAAVLLSYVDLAVFTADSHVLLREGRAMLFYDEGPRGGELSNHGLFMMLAQGTSVRLGIGYLPEIPPLLTLCLAGVFVQQGARALADRGADPRRALAVAILAVVALLSPYLLILHAFYIHVNMAAAVYLFLSIVCFAGAERENEPGWLHFAFLFMLGFVLQRVEAVGLALVVVAMAWSRTRLPGRTWRPWLAGIGLGVLLWHVEIAYLAGPSSRILSPARIRIVIGAIVVWSLVVTWLHRPGWEDWRRRLAPIALVTLALSVVGALLLRTEGVLASLGSLASNLSGLEWGGLWPVMATLALLAVPLLGRNQFGAASPARGRWLFLAAALSQVAFVILLGAMRVHPFTPYWQDSGNRMLIHATPLLFFWLLLVYGPAVVSSERADEYNEAKSPSGGETHASRTPDPELRR